MWFNPQLMYTTPSMHCAIYEKYKRNCHTQLTWNSLIKVDPVLYMQLQVLKYSASDPHPHTSSYCRKNIDTEGNKHGEVMSSDETACQVLMYLERGVWAALVLVTIQKCLVLIKEF